MPATKAQALVPGLIVKDADPAADADALERLAIWVLQRYTPIVAADPPDGVVIDISGAAHLQGGERPLLEGLLERLSGSGITAKAAIAETWGAAHGLARYSGQSAVIARPGESRKAMLPLPLHALRLQPQTIDALRRLGFETIGELAATPRAPLALRFGSEVGRLLDRAMGDLDEPIDPIAPDELIVVRQNFAEPIGAPETLARYTGKLATALCLELQERGLGAKRLDLLFHRVDNRIEAIRVGTALPVRDAKRLTRLLCDKIEKVDPGFGIEIMVLSAPVAEPLGAKQSISSLVQEPNADITALIDTLSNRVGENRLYRFTPVQSDVPERSVKKIAPTAQRTGDGWPDNWPRPSRLFAHPEPIETVAVLPDNPPVTFTWRGVRRRVKRADGPERVFGEWWKRDAELEAVRDYFQVEAENGERFWLFRQGDGVDASTGSHRWFIHGIFG